LRSQVSVLLATYNGAEFLPEQLRSIESQTLPVARVTVRDDGSTDNTLSVLQEWAAGRAEAHLLRGPRLGVARNFFALLSSPDKDSDFFAFSDQDDVWLPEKVEAGVGCLRRCNGRVPLMYCSRLEYVDEELKHLGYSRIPRRLDFANALVENVATGCTVLLNRRARDMIVERLPERAFVHDWWCYLVVSAFGRVIYDSRPQVKYRQHGGNAIGGTSSVPRMVWRRLSRFIGADAGARLLSDQALDFQRCFGGSLPPREKRILERFLGVRGGLRSRVAYNAAMDVGRQSWIDTAILRTLILMGRV